MHSLIEYFWLWLKSSMMAEALLSLLIVLAGWICGSWWPADLPRVWRVKATDDRDSRRDGCPRALPHHLLHQSGWAAQNTGDLMISELEKSYHWFPQDSSHVFCCVTLKDAGEVPTQWRDTHTVAHIVSKLLICTVYSDFVPCFFWLI